MEGKLKESGGYFGWHEQLLTEKQDLLVTIATLVLPTLVCLCVYSLFVQSSPSCKKNCLAEAPMLTTKSSRTLDSVLLLSECRNINFFLVKLCLHKSLLRHTVCSYIDEIVSVPVSSGDKNLIYYMLTQTRKLPNVASSLLVLIKCTDHLLLISDAVRRNLWLFIISCNIELCNGLDLKPPYFANLSLLYSEFCCV